MIKNFKNISAINMLIRQLTGRRPFDPDVVRLQCKTVIYTCFLMGIEPFQLPISDVFTGELSQSQKRDFMHQYLSLHMDSTSRYSAASQLFNSETAWSFLMLLVDEIVDTHKT